MSEMQEIRTHKDLDVWKESVELAINLYEYTKIFPKEEIYGLTQQLRRAVVSISSNIAEGAARNSNKEFVQFLYIALGSLSEVETQLIIANRLNYCNNLSDVNVMLINIRKKLLGLIKYVKKQIT